MTSNNLGQEKREKRKMRLMAGKRLIVGVLLTLLFVGPVWGQAVDQAQLSGQIIIDPPTNAEFGQTFTAGLDGKLVAVRLFIGKADADGSDITVLIRDTNSVGGILDTVLASGMVAKEDIADEPNWIEVALTPTVPTWEQTVGKTLALTIEQGATGENEYGIEIGLYPTPYPYGTYFPSFMFGNAPVPTDYDMAFQTLVVAEAYVYYFQQGVDYGQGVYAEANDVTIGNSAFLPADDYLRVEAIGLAEKYNTLLRFRGIEKNLTNLRVVSAFLTLTFHNYGLQNSNPAIINVHSLFKPFSDDDTKCNWTNYDTGLSWEAPGAQGLTDRSSIYTTTDLGPHSMFLPYETGWTYVFEIPVSEVRRWVNSPESNHGVLLAMKTSQATPAEFFSCEYVGVLGDLSRRPLLTIIAADGCDKIPADINDDCYVNEYDLNLMREQWLLCDGGSADIVDAGDGCVNFLDYALLAAQWLKCSDPGNATCLWPN